MKSNQVLTVDEVHPSIYRCVIVFDWLIDHDKLMADSISQEERNSLRSSIDKSLYQKQPLFI